MNTTNSAVGFARQASKGTEMTYESGFHWVLATDALVGPQQLVIGLPLEMGGGLFPRGRVKTGVFGAGAVNGIPRPESLGLILLGSFGDLSTATQTPGSGPSYYRHTFTISTDPAATDYMTARRTIGGVFGEKIVDCRVESVGMAMQAANFVQGSWSLNGITPEYVASIAAWTGIDPDDAPPFIAAEGSAKIQTADTSTTLPIRAANITVTNAQDVPREFIVGAYYPRDIDIVSKAAVVTYVVYLPDAAWYQKLMYDPAGSSSTWLADIYDSSEFELKFTTAEMLNPAADPGDQVPWDLTYTAATSHWAVEPLGLTAGGLVVAQVTGVVVQNDASSSITAVLDNLTTDYDVATS